MATTNTVKLPTGVRALRLAKITADNRDTLTVGTVIDSAQDALQKFSIQPESSSERVYASNKTIATINSKNGGKCSIELAYLPKDLEKELQGVTVGEDGILVFTEEDRTYDFAVSAEITYEDGTYALVGLGKVNFQLVDEDADTKEDKAKPQSIKLEGEILSRINDNFYKLKSYSDDAGFDKAKFDTKLFKAATV
ncbi:major tail protein [Macrococcus carouselicus]|uniref:Phage tail protein n=1 Tax=Macrococcus carouselicus TaxID=69969 RepID=A0A9Q8CMM0_9STAP|nr:major tail protein [Macrococcus carouselicus]TDM04067.1 hypothetical protein ERX40_02545 [Macrococcus carouselicus]